ncbi:fatty acid elongase [Conidiobolus coronatus NRRL 28638]|uniref:Elongation of fatty acids protein n=1 Tax=Conidiobolus coronatus (strain ATCC 28846 / CBS 209.66 / NRRL 28638) TaxID=796925 RepID=A0A137P5V2_CONC2|nr:fatty acid elongase [Conidiobolus coronatus NRRL 28638]|eukprot:KXN70392.1 fatty acid elongase [Conidiobolus coronatus NRRL 28638]
MSVVANPQDLLFSSWFPTFDHWKTPIATGLIYLVATSIWNQYNRKYATKTKPTAIFKFFVSIHNLALFAYSFITFINVAPVVYQSFATRPFLDAYCDAGQQVWNSTLYYWTWLFYLSKYYEIVDTMIILLKGNTTSLLQTYHHAGAIFTMWAGFSSHAFPIWIFVTFNSFIHSLMYLYYFLTTINIRPPGKKYLTYLQITQFLVGGSIALSYAVTNSCERTTGQHLAQIANCIYLVPLTYLFAQFAVKSYHRKFSASKTTDAKAKKSS